MKFNNTTLQAALVETGESAPFCGGSVISNRHVLSAAHCTHNRNTGRVESSSALEVLVGMHDFGENVPASQRISVARILPHKKYDDSTVGHDISLLTLVTTITFSDKVSPICLPAPPPNVFSLYPDYEGQVVTTTGWGAMANGESPSVLQEVNITVTSNKDCRKAYAATHEIRP